MVVAFLDKLGEGPKVVGPALFWIAIFVLFIVEWVVSSVFRSNKTTKRKRGK